MKKQTLPADRKLSRHRQPLKTKAFSPDPVIAELQQEVRTHGICWNIWPLYHIDREGRAIQIGFEFSLIGGHYHGEEIVEPGCPQCLEIYKDLERIARWIIPQKGRQDGYEIVIVDALPHYYSQRRFKPDVVQIVKVIHREGLNDSVDACEVGCLMEMKGKAESLGIANIGIRPA